MASQEALQDIFFKKAAPENINGFIRIKAGDSAKDFINYFFAYLSNQALAIISSVAALALLYLAISIILARGDIDKIKTIKTSVFYIFIGFFLAIFAVIIVNIVINLPEELLKTKNL